MYIPKKRSAFSPINTHSYIYIYLQIYICVYVYIEYLYAMHLVFYYNSIPISGKNIWPNAICPGKRLTQMRGSCIPVSFTVSSTMHRLWPDYQRYAGTKANRCTRREIRSRRRDQRGADRPRGR